MATWDSGSALGSMFAKAYSEKIFDRIVGSNFADPLSMQRGVFEIDQDRRVPTPWARFYLNDGDFY